MIAGGKQLGRILLAGMVGALGCGAPLSDASRSPDDGDVMSAPRDTDGGDTYDPDLHPNGAADPADGMSLPETAGVPQDSPSAAEPQSAAPDSPDVEDESPFELFHPDSAEIPDAGMPNVAAPPAPAGPRAPRSSDLGIPPTPSPPTADPGVPLTATPPLAADGFVLEKVYYGTNRRPEETASERWKTYGTALRRFQLLLVAGLALCGTVFFVPQRRLLLIIPAVLCLTGSAWFGRQALLEYQTARRDDASRNRRYGNEIHFVDGQHVLERGYCWVSVPVQVHERGSGELEEPGLFEVQADPQKHFTLQRVHPVDRTSFLEDLRAAVQSSASKHAFVFIHGYNVLFSEAALRTAQLRYDLDFDGPAAFFSWPSNGSILSYASDEETANLTERSGVLHEFLIDFIRETGAESVHLIAHSMGNRLVTRAFEKLPETTNSQGHPTISHLIMAAPDVNPAEFLLLADRIRELTRARTLYASEKDIALIGSEVLRMSNYTRLGQGGQSRVIVDGVQTIDASDLDRELFDLGHSYYVHPLVMKDLKHLLNAAEITQLRPWLMSVEDYWIFRDD